jgi:hypothetical protein
MRSIVLVCAMGVCRYGWLCLTFPLTLLAIADEVIE